MNKKKRLYTFYCQPCDHAWLEIKAINEDCFFSLCEYCKSKRKGEVVSK